MKNYTFEIVKCEDNPEEVCIQFTDEFCKDQDWRIDDVIDFVKNEDGSVSMINLSWKERNESLSRPLY